MLTHFKGCDKIYNVEIYDYFNTQLEKTISTAISEIESFTDIYMFEFVDKTGMLQKINKVSPYINPIKYVLMGAAVLLVADTPAGNF